MVKKVALVIVALAFFVSIVPAWGDTVFNDASKCIAGWGKGCCTPCAKSTPAAAPVVSKPMAKTDILGNKVPAQTEKGGKVTLGQ